MNTLIILGLLAWYLSGIIGFIYWWTKDYDYKTRDILTSLYVGVAGPVTFLIGAHIHADGKTLIKKRDVFRD